MREELLFSVILGHSLALATLNNETEETENDFQARGDYFYYRDYRICLYDKNYELCCTEDHGQAGTWGWIWGLSLDQSPGYLGSRNCYDHYPDRYCSVQGDQVNSYSIELTSRSSTNLNCLINRFRYTHLISNVRLKKSGQIITPYLMKMATFAGLITLQCLMNGCQADVLIRIVKLSMMEYGTFLLISDLILIVLSRAPWDGTGRPRTVLVLGRPKEP